MLSAAKNLNAGKGTSASLKASWETLGFVQGHGNSNSPKNYSFTDNLAHDLALAHVQYRLKQIDADGSFRYSNTVEIKLEKPTAFKLEQNYPNPFNPVTTIKYSIPNFGVQTSSSLQNVVLKVYDILGREVTTLVNELKAPGNDEITFDGSKLASGIYFYKLQAGDFKQIKQMVLMK